MDINIEINKNQIDYIKIQKMSFIFNAIESGWSVKKHEDKYIFSKKHEGKKEVFLESYIHNFIKTNISGCNPLGPLFD